MMNHKLALVLSLIVVAMMLLACGADTADEQADLRATITAQSAEAENLRLTVAAQETGLAQLAESPQPTDLPEDTVEPATPSPVSVEDLVTVQLENEAMIGRGNRRWKALIYSVENRSDYPVSVSFDVRFYDSSGTMLAEEHVVQCQPVSFIGPPYTPSHGKVWLNVMAYQLDEEPDSLRLMNLDVSVGCALDQSFYFEAFGMGSRLPEVAYEGIELSSAEATLSQDELYGGSEVEISAMLSNTGDRDASFVYVSAVGLDASETPIIHAVAWHEDSVPNGERVRFSEGVSMGDEFTPIIPVLGNQEDIESWQFTAVGLTPAQ